MNLFYLVWLPACSIGLFIYGYYSVFKQKEIIAFYLRMASRKYYPKWHARVLQRNTQEKWFYINLRIVGMVAILMGIFFLVAFYILIKE